MRRGLIGLVVCAVIGLTGGVVAAQDKPAAPEPAQQGQNAPADPAGDWEGVVESPNGPITFTLSLKIDKEQVAGDISSSEGSMPVTGKWADAKLEFTFDYNGGPIVATAGLKDGGLAGEMNYGGGQAIMPWTAKKKAAR